MRVRWYGPRDSNPHDVAIEGFWFILFGRKRVTGASAAAFVLGKDTLVEQILNIAQGGIGRALLKQRPLGRRELALEPVQQAIEHVALALICFRCRMLLPEVCLLKHSRQGLFGAVECTIKTAEKPFEPRRDIKPAFLRCFKHVVIGFALKADLRGHAVKALRTFFRASKRHIGNGACDAAVTVVEWVNGDEPQMRQRGLY